MTNIAVHKWWWGALLPLWITVFVYATFNLLPLIKGKSVIDVWKAHNLRVLFLAGLAGVLRIIECITRFTVRRD
jgi:hypothetical protein